MAAASTHQHREKSPDDAIPSCLSDATLQLKQPDRSRSPSELARQRSLKGMVEELAKAVKRVEELAQGVPETEAEQRCEFQLKQLQQNDDKIDWLIKQILACQDKIQVLENVIRHNEEMLGKKRNIIKELRGTLHAAKTGITLLDSSKGESDSKGESGMGTDSSDDDTEYRPT